MQFSGVTFEQVKDTAAYHNMRAIPAYAPGGKWVGACLRPAGEYYRRTSVSSIVWGTGTRRVNAVCWCGHRRFLMELFQRYPEATVRTSTPWRPGGRAVITVASLEAWLGVSMVSPLRRDPVVYSLDLCLHDH